MCGAPQSGFARLISPMSVRSSAETFGLPTRLRDRQRQYARNPARCQQMMVSSIVAALNKRGAKIVISQHPRRAQPLKIDEEMYKWRHLIENFFCKLKEFKRIAMRCDKTDQSFAAMIYLAAAVINSR